MRKELEQDFDHPTSTSTKEDTRDLNECTAPVVAMTNVNTQ